MACAIGPQNDGWRRRKNRPGMALTHRERIDTQFFGENRQFDDAVEPIGRGNFLAGHWMGWVENDVQNLKTHDPTFSITAQRACPSEASARLVDGSTIRGRPGRDEITKKPIQQLLSTQ